MKTKTILLFILFVLTMNAVYSQTFPYAVYNSASGNQNIRDGACNTATIITSLAYNNKLVASTSQNGCGYFWYKVDLPCATQSGNLFGWSCGGSSGCDMTSASNTGYVEVYNTSSSGLFVRTSAGNGNVTIASANAKVWDTQRFATTGITTIYQSYTWYQIYLPNNCSQTTGWCSGQYLNYYPPSTTYTVTTSSSPSNGGSTSGSNTYNSNQSVTVTATPNANWSFVNWTENSNVVWSSPSYSFTITANRNLVANFSPNPQYGAVNVVINPSAAVSAGATWQLDGTGSWNASNFTTPNNVPVGSHYINYYPSVPGWTAPLNQPITVSANQTTNQIGTYTQGSGTVTVSISPPGAVSAGALWDIDSGPLQTSNTTLNATVGLHTINFNTISGWITPNSQTITIQANQNTPVTGVYTLSGQIGSIQMDLFPCGALTNGAQWNVDNGQWQSSGTIQYNIPVGTHTISFYSASGWVTPNPIQLVVNANLTTAAEATYSAINPGVSVNTYPFCYDNAGCNNTNGDPWGFVKYNCTSYCAWKINEALGITDHTFNVSHPFHNTWFGNSQAPDCYTGGNYRLSDACYWDDILDSHNILVDNNPAVGAIAHWNPGVNGVSALVPGHVAYVESMQIVGQDTIVWISNYNGFNINNGFTACDYGYFQIHTSLPYSTTNRKPEHYIHMESSGLGGVGIGQLIPQQTFYLFPNPSNGEISISNNNFKNQNLEIFNAMGQLVKSVSVADQKSISIDMSDMPTGLYFATMHSEGGVETQRFEIAR